jgi:hypothetical protein
MKLIILEFLLPQFHFLLMPHTGDYEVRMLGYYNEIVVARAGNTNT